MAPNYAFLPLSRTAGAALASGFYSTTLRNVHGFVYCAFGALRSLVAHITAAPMPCRFVRVRRRRRRTRRRTKAAFSARFPALVAGRKASSQQVHTQIRHSTPEVGRKYDSGHAGHPAQKSGGHPELARERSRAQRGSFSRGDTGDCAVRLA